MNVGQRLRNILRVHGITQVEIANALNLSQSYINSVVNGKKKLPLDTLESICTYIGISLSTFFAQPEEDRKIPLYLSNFYKIANSLSKSDIDILLPVVERMIDSTESKNKSITSISGAAAAGLPLCDAADPDASIAVPSKYCDSSRYLIFQARGDSMEPRITDGSYVVCQRDDPPEDGAIAVVRVSSNGDDEYAIKRFYQRGDQVELRSINPAHAPMFYAASEVLSADRVVAYLSPSASPQIR